jgi:hypothetical protein
LAQIYERDDNKESKTSHDQPFIALAAHGWCVVFVKEATVGYQTQRQAVHVVSLQLDVRWQEKGALACFWVQPQGRQCRVVEATVCAHSKRIYLFLSTSTNQQEGKSARNRASKHQGAAGSSALARAKAPMTGSGRL